MKLASSPQSHHIKCGVLFTLMKQTDHSTEPKNRPEVGGSKLLIKVSKQSKQLWITASAKWVITTANDANISKCSSHLQKEVEYNAFCMLHHIPLNKFLLVFHREHLLVESC